MSVLGKAQKSIEEFNRQFEDISGYRTFDLSDPVKKPGLLSQDYFNRRKAEAEKEKFVEYKGEEKEINDVLFNVHTGNTSVNELATLATKPYGKNAVREVLTKYAPETPIEVYGDEILNKGVHWAEAVQNIKTKNRYNATQLFEESENESLKNIQSAINDLQIKTEVSDYISTPGGGALKSDVTATDKIPAIDINNPESVASALKFLEDKGYLVGKDGKKSDYSLDKLHKDLAVVYEKLKNSQPIAPEIEALDDKIFNAVTAKQSLSEVGENQQADLSENYGTRANHFKIGLNYIKELQPGTYKGVLLGLNEKGEISETDYQQISKLGQDIYNKQVFRNAATNPELIDKETNFDYRTHQDIKAEYSKDIGEWLKSNGYKNFRVYPAELIKRAATAQGLENKEVVNELILEEGIGLYDAIPKTGGTEALVRGIEQPIGGIVSTFKKWFLESPAETYLRSKKIDTGTGQKVPDVFGNISNELPSDRNNTWYDILEGAGQFIPQVVLTRGIGGGLAGATGLSLSQVPRAALTAAQASNISAYGGTFVSAFLQTYGNAYSDALSKTGDPATAKLMGGIDAVTTSLAELILPDVRIAAKAFSGIKGQFVNNIAELVKKGGDISTLRKSARPFIEKFVTNTVGITSQEVSEEVVTQWANYIDESIFSPGTVKDRDLGKETWDTIKATAVSMIIPSVLGAGGASLNKDFTKQGLHAAAINFEDYKSSLQKSLINDNITQDEFNLGIKILGTHRESIFASPAASENGAKLTNDQRAEYAYQDTIIKIEKEKSAQITGVQKELSEKKIKEAENIQREILMPKETKTEETEAAPTELTDQENSIIDLIKEKTELSFLDPATQGRIIYDAAQNPATQKDAIQMLVDQSSDPQSLELSVGAKVTEAVLGLPQKSTQKTQEELTGEAAEISAAAQAPEAAPITTQEEKVKPKLVLSGKFVDTEKTDAAVNEIKELGEPNQFNDKQVVIDNVKVNVERDGGKIWLKEITAIEQGKGEGTKVLNQIKSIADKHGIDIVLHPTAIKNTTEEQLIDWYKKNGFEDYTQGRLIYKPQSQAAPITTVVDEERFTAKGGNKVVDDKGAPIEVFHGTNAPFEGFDKDKLGSKNFLAESASEGFFFAGSQKTSEAYTGINSGDVMGLNIQGSKHLSTVNEKYKEEDDAIRQKVEKINSEEKAISDEQFDKVYKVLYANITDEQKQKLKYIDPTWHQWQERASKRIEEEGVANELKELNQKKLSDLEKLHFADKGLSRRIVSANLDMKNPYIFDYDGKDGSTEGLTSHIKKAKKAGHDGVIFKNLADGGEKDNIYVVFKPEQIKITNKNILESTPTQQQTSTPIGGEAVEKPKIRVTAEQVQERQPAKIREQYIENYAIDIDSKYNWKITSVMNGEERRKAIRDIRAGKNTAPARKLEKEIQESIERGVININRGGGSQTQNVEIPINEWFSFTPIEQNEAIQEAENTEIEDNFIASIVRNNEITLQNIDDLKNLFNGFPYNEQDFAAVKTFLSGETTGITQTEGARQEGQRQSAAEEIVTPTIAEQGKDLAAKIRQLKTKRDTLQANIFGIPIAIYDGLIETIATAVENGAKLADAINNAINSIKDKNFDREGFRKSVEDFAVGKRPRVTTEGEIADVSVPTKNEGEEFEVSDENITGITHAQTEVTRERFVLPQYDKNPETIAGWDAEADKLIAEGFNIQELLNKMANGYMPSPVEQRIMIKYIASLESKVEKNPSDENLTELKRAIELSDRVGGSEVGKTLVARKGSIHRDDSLATFLIREMEENGVDVLTEEQKSKVKKEYEEIRAANAAYKKKIEELQEENARLKAGETVSKERQRARKGRKTTEEFQDERKKISDNIREKLKKSRSEVSATLVPYAKELITIAPDVAKLMRSYVEEGITKLADIVDNIHGVLKDEINGITKKDVLDIIAGEYAEPKQTRNELAATLRDLKTEATLVNQFEKLEQGEVPITEKKRIRRNQDLADLRQKIKENDLTKIEDAKKRIKVRIEKIEEQLRTGNFEIPEKKLPIKLDREGRELQDKLIKLKQDREVRILTERYNNRSARDKAIDRAIEIANVPRSIMASMDYSAPLRQAIIATIAHPRTAIKAAREMFISSFSQKNFDRWFFDLKNDSRYDLMQETGLSITDPHSPFLTAKEEAYMNNLTEKIPIIGRLIKGSERAYVQYLNKMRVDLFNRFADRFEEQGKTFENSKELYEKMAGYINNQTGRGKIGKLEDSAPVLNAIFFSPRLIASRLNLLNPVYFAKLPKELKIMYGKDMAKFIGVGLSVVALAQFAGGSGDDEDKITVETDPRSSDFMKIRQKNTRWDIWGGFQPYIRLIAQMITGEAKSAGTGKIYDIDGKGAFGRDRLDVLGTFFRNKLAPIPAGSYNILSGRNTVGEDVTLGSQLKESLIPLNFTSIKESVNDEGIKALFTVGVPSTFGVGTATYEPKVSKGDTVKIYQESGSKVREATQEEYDKYIQDRDKKAEEKLDKIEKRKTVWLNKYGEITIDEKAKTKVKQFDKLTEDELKDLQSRLKSQAANEVKKTIKY